MLKKLTADKLGDTDDEYLSDDSEDYDRSDSFCSDEDEENSVEILGDSDEAEEYRQRRKDSAVSR